MKIVATPGLITLLLVVDYLALCTWAYWRLIARPIRANLRADIADLEALSSGSDTLAKSTGLDTVGAASRVENLLGNLGSRLDTWKTFDVLSWRGSTEVEAAYRLVAAQVYVPYFLTPTEVDARLIVARGWLDEYKSKPECNLLGTQIDLILAPPATPAISPNKCGARLLRRLTAKVCPPDAPIIPEDPTPRKRALLGQALALTYVGAGAAEDLLWHRKTAMVLVASLTAIVLLAYVDNAAVVLLYGAFGGLLQRLWQLVYERGITSSHPLYWSTLFLAPAAGGLAAVGGLHLFSVLHAANAIGPSLSSIGWDHTFEPAKRTGNLAVAFLLGFSARLLGTLATKSTSAVSPSPPSASSVPSAP